VVFGLAPGSTGSGNFGAVTDNGDGTYTATFTATTAGTVTFNATTGGATITDGQSVTITAGPVSAANSSVTSPADNGTIASGDTTPVTFSAEDASGNPVSGLTDVVFGLDPSSTGSGTFGPVTDNGDGTYTATFTATTAGPVTFNASTGGTTVTDSQSVTITAGPASAATSSLTSPADGGSVASGDTVPVTLTAQDAAGNPVAGLTDVVFGLAPGSTGSGNFGAVTDNGDGTYTATFTATTVGTVTFNATTGGATITDGQPVTITAGPVDQANSSVASPADGGTIASGATAPVTFTAQDANGNPISGLTDVVFGLDGSSTGNGTFGAVTDNGDGTYTATFTAVGAGTVTFNAATGGVTVTDSQSTTITAGPVSAANSSVTSPADNGTIASGDTAPVTLTAEDAAGNPVPGLTDVVFGLAPGSTGSGNFGPVTDNGDGTYTATFTAVGAGSVTFNAATGGVTVTDSQSTTITAGPVSAANSSVTSDATPVIPIGAVVTVTFTANDAAGNPVAGLTDVVIGLDPASLGTGTFSAVTDNGDGTYTATFTADTDGPIMFDATTGGVTVTDSSPVLIA
jgi:adhesin/invasin